MNRITALGQSVYQDLSISVKLVVMRRRSQLVWVLLSSIALTILLAAVCRPHHRPGSVAGFSAPPVPRVQAASAACSVLPRPHVDSSAVAIRPDCSDLLSALLTHNHGQQDARREPYYGPLYHRPPPALS